MKAAKPVEKDNKAHQRQSQKQKQKEPVVVHQSEAEVAGTQMQRSGSPNVVTGSGNPNNNLVGRNGNNPMTQTIYDQGSEIMYGRFQESLKQTGDVNHPDTKKAEKDYMSTKNVSQVQNYNDHKSGTSLSKTSQNETTKSKAENQEVVSELILQAGGKGRVTHKGDVYTLHFDTYKTDEYNRSINTNYKLDRYAERMILGQEVNHSWTPEYEDAYVKTLVSSGGSVDYRKSDYKGVVGGEGTGNGKKSGKEAGERNTLKPNQGKTLEELKSELAKLPNEIKKIIGTEKGNLTLADYQRLLVIAEKLKQLSPEDIVLFQHLTIKATDNIELFEKAVDLFLAKKEELKSLSEQAEATNVSKSMQGAIESSWQGFDDTKIGKMSESDQYDLAREQTGKATEAQLQYMKDHPGEVAKDFVKSATLMNTPETAEAVVKDVKEAANGDVNAWQRLAAGLGAGAKVSGWLLAVACIAAVISMFTGIGELAVIVEALLMTTIALSGLESEARIIAASQAKDSNTFKENVNQAAAARTNFMLAVAMLGFAKAAGFLAKTLFPKTLTSIGENIKNFRTKLREKIGLNNLAELKTEFLAKQETYKQSLIESREQAKEYAAKTADELAQIDVQAFVEKLDRAGDDFYGQAATPNEQTVNWKAISQTSEGLKIIETFKADLLQELRTEVPQYIDALVQEPIEVMNILEEGIKLVNKTEAYEAYDFLLEEWQKYISPEEVTRRANEKQTEIIKNSSEKALKEIDENLKKNDTKRAHEKLAEIIKNLSEKKALQEANENLKKNDTFEKNTKEIEETGDEIKDVNKKENISATSKTNKGIRTKVFAKNVGEQATKVTIGLVDKTGKEILQLSRSMEKSGKEVYFDYYIEETPMGYVQMMSSEEAALHNLPINEGETVMHADIKIDKQILDQYSGIGKIMLDDANQYLSNNAEIGKPDGILGDWRASEAYAEYGGQSVNLKDFWNAVDNEKLTYEQAAFKTFTGKWAKENGFTKAVIRGNEDVSRSKVLIKFIK